MGAELHGRKVLVLDDENLMAMLLEDMLEELGCRVVARVQTVTEALVALDREAPELAVLDLNLGGQLSYPVADALATRGVPFVIVTGYRHLHVDERYRDRPVLEKPFPTRQLADVLKEALGARG